MPNESAKSRKKSPRLRASALLMVIAILGVTGFQVYWLKNNYDREKQNLAIKTRASFRQTILALQASKLKLESLALRVDTANAMPARAGGKTPKRISLNRKPASPEPVISLLNLIQEKMRDTLRLDSAGNNTLLITVKNDTLRHVILDSNRKLRSTIRTISIGERLDSLPPPGLIEEVHVNKKPGSGSGSVVTIGYGGKSGKAIKADSLLEAKKEKLFIDNGIPPEPPAPGEPFAPGGNAVFRFLYDVDSISLRDSVTVHEITEAYTRRLREDHIDVGFRVSRLDSLAPVPPEAVTIGFSRPTSYDLSLHGTFGYMFGQLKLPILFSFLLVGITIASFVLLYRNMLKQQRLAELKNEFISNITHELKTPIATVGVAIEALKNFNAIEDPVRTREYLAISQNELQRLNLLVDKVLKLSMFEKKEIELKYERLNLEELVREVVGSMRLQIEKYGAQVSVSSEGDTGLAGDRLHLLSVVFNLLDNALKYSRENPQIGISLRGEENRVELRVSDNGIGIPPEYREKIFEKFFRIPHGDTHNAKGYGLGLSYVAQVVRKHRGSISVDSQSGGGASFLISLPKQPVHQTK